MPVRVQAEEDFDFSFLEVGCVIRKGSRKGKVTEVRDNGVVVNFAEWTHPITGEVEDAGPVLYKKKVIHQDHLYCQLEIISRPLSFVGSRSIAEVQRDERDHKETARMRVRKACVLTSEELIAEGLMGATRWSMNATPCNWSIAHASSTRASPKRRWRPTVPIRSCLSTARPCTAPRPG